MVLFLLCVKAELDGVQSISLLKSSNLCFSVRNPLSDYETREKIVFNPQETLEQDEGDREPPHHFCVKWEGSKKASTLIVLDEEGAKSAMKKIKKKGGKNKDSEIDVPREVTSDDSGDYVPVLAMPSSSSSLFFFPTSRILHSAIRILPSSKSTLSPFSEWESKCIPY